MWEKSLSRVRLCDPMDGSLPGSSVHRIFQARTLEWGAIAFSRRSSQPRDRTQVSHIVGRRFNDTLSDEPTWWLLGGREEALSFPYWTQLSGLGEGPLLPSVDRSVSVQALLHKPSWVNLVLEPPSQCYSGASELTTQHSGEWKFQVWN